MFFFDSIQTTAAGIVSGMFGVPATWQPSDNSPMQSAVILYKDATEKHKLSDVDFEIERYVMEYRNTEFIGLKKSMDEGGDEQVIIEVSKNIFLTFLVRRIETKFDGKTIIAYLNPPEE